jgi:MraZ protein
VLTGEVEHQLDDRGRVVVPRAWREDLEHGCFITRGWYGCLWLFTWEAWRDILEKLKTVKLTDTAGDRLKQFLGRGEKVFLDAQGRLLLSPSLREFAGIQGDLVLAGAIDRVEIWAKERSDAFQQERFSPEQMLDVVEKAKELGL